jgi:tRNA(Ile)-lysidine synthase
VAASGPLSKRDFAALMVPLGPFESNPRIAVALSGGCDSLALSVLAHDWVQARGGEVIALTVDHRLRAGSTAEARRVHAQCVEIGISHHILTRRGPKPEASIQDAARRARYALLTDWCRDNGVLHLFLGHHLEDQAETFLLRLSRGSGIDGLSAMTPVQARAEIRLLRPLLTVPKARLRAVLEKRKLSWIEDPSNLDPNYARIRFRRALPMLAEEGLDVARLAATATRMARARTALENLTAGVLAQAVSVFPEGYGLVKAEILGRADEEIALRALSRILMCIGARPYPPRLAPLERLYDALRSGKPGTAKTLAGCRIIPLDGKNRGGERLLLICREPAAASERIELKDSGALLWDGRFKITWKKGKGGPSKPVGRLCLARLGRDGWVQALKIAPSLRDNPLPYPARLALPALWRGKKLLAVPHLELSALSPKNPRFELLEAVFSPPSPLV